MACPSDFNDHRLGKSEKGQPNDNPQDVSDIDYKFLPSFAPTASLSSTVSNGPYHPIPSCPNLPELSPRVVLGSSVISTNRVDGHMSTSILHNGHLDDEPGKYIASLSRPTPERPSGFTNFDLTQDYPHFTEGDSAYHSVLPLWLPSWDVGDTLITVSAWACNDCVAFGH
jgi:hypothetical protein